MENLKVEKVEKVSVGHSSFFHSHTMILQYGQTLTGTGTLWIWSDVLGFYLVMVATGTLYDKE